MNSNTNHSDDSDDFDPDPDRSLGAFERLGKITNESDHFANAGQDSIAFPGAHLANAFPGTHWQYALDMDLFRQFDNALNQNAGKL